MYILEGEDCVYSLDSIEEMFFYCTSHTQSMHVFTLFSGQDVRDKDLTIVKHRTHRKFPRQYHGIDILQPHITDYGEQKFNKYQRVWTGMKGSEAAYCAFIKAAQNANGQCLAGGVRATQPTTHPEGIYIHIHTCSYSRCMFQTI